MHFAIFLSCEFTAMAVMNPPEKKLEKRTSVPWKKTATESLKLYTVFCFDFQSCVTLGLYKLGCKCMTALLTVTYKAKRPQVKAKQKVLQNSLPCQIFWQRVANSISIVIVEIFYYFSSFSNFSLESK